MILVYPCRAKVVIGDRDTKGGEKTVGEIERDGGYVCLALYVWERKGGGLTMLNRKAVFVKCDVLSWEDQLSMFETAISKYGSVDIVVRASFHSRFCSFHAGKTDIYFSNRYLTRELRKSHISIRSPSMQVVNR